MLVFHSHCQLGNQMFIYACARSLARKKKLKYCLSEINELHYFNLSNGENLRNKLKFIGFRIYNLFFPSKYKKEHFQDNREDYSLRMSEDKNNYVWYYGYFQGENYFYDNDIDIRTRFKIKNEYIKIFNHVKKNIFREQEYSVVHIRLKDYKTFGPDYLDGPDLSLPFTYYHNLIKSILENGNPLVFLSDEIETVKKEFSYVKNAYFSDHDPIIDLQFIINASTCVLSCSTFSWWGAWLNSNKKKTIFIPEHFLGFKVAREYPVNMIPDGWNKVNIDL
jgi:hypothetical protein